MSFRDPRTAAIAAFLREIGLEVRSGALAEATALPGIDIERGALVIDEDRLLCPGDLLHEAGHLAVVPAARRAAFHHDVGNDPAEEMTAIAWSYAAALHLNLDPALVFHADGYRGGGESILDSFRLGSGIGVPMLGYLGLTHAGPAPRPPGAQPFPAMIRWLRP
ncbi:MAG TPA: hypothetical protein VGC36_14700 [Rhizomicrobium sp.]